MILVDKTKKELKQELLKNGLTDVDQICKQQVVLKGNRKVDLNKLTARDFIYGYGMVVKDYRAGLKMGKGMKDNFDNMFQESLDHINTEILPRLSESSEDPKNFGEALMVVNSTLAYIDCISIDKKVDFISKLFTHVCGDSLNDEIMELAKFTIESNMRSVAVISDKKAKAKQEQKQSKK